MQQQQFSDSLERDDRKEMVKRSTVGLTPPSQDGLLPFSYLLSGLSRNSFPRPTLIAGAHHFSFLFTSDVYVVNAGRQRTAVFYQENCSPYSSNSSVSHRMRNGPEDKKYIFWKRKKKVERWNLKERKGEKKYPRRFGSMNQQQEEVISCSYNYYNPPVPPFGCCLASALSVTTHRVDN